MPLGTETEGQKSDRRECLEVGSQRNSVIGKWWAHSDLNRGPSDYESPALTAELWARNDCLREPNWRFRFPPNRVVRKGVFCSFFHGSKGNRGGAAVAQSAVRDLSPLPAFGLHYARVRLRSKLIWIFSSIARQGTAQPRSRKGSSAAGQFDPTPNQGRVQRPGMRF